MSADLSKLSGDELEATFLVLGERAQCISNAQAAVRAEIQRRARPPEEEHVLVAEEIQILDEALADAPDMMARLQVLEDARLEEIQMKMQAEAEALVDG